MELKTIANTWSADEALPLWKRGLDLLLIVALAPFIVLVGIFVALIVKIGSPGPLFFCQTRVGLRGSHFLLYKFRTMHVNAETESHRDHARQLMDSHRPLTKLDALQDPRLIPLGGFLRATGLDELPQVLNVLFGNMSFVGPRPCIPYEYEVYKPWHRHRLDAVPGLTGLWQVSGKNRTTFEQMVHLDIEYSRKKSLWLDLTIISKTLPALWTQWQDQRSIKQAEAGECGAANIVKSVQSHL